MAETIQALSVNEFVKNELRDPQNYECPIIFILSLGGFGNGATRFISEVANMKSNLAFEGATRDCSVWPVTVGGSRVVLASVPPFEMLHNPLDKIASIARIIIATGNDGAALVGFIILREVNHFGSDEFGLRIVESICGEDAFQYVMLASADSNRWGMRTNSDADERRGNETSQSKGAWERILAKGATHTTPALAITELLLKKMTTPVPLQLHQELLAKKGHLVSTTAGMIIAEEVRSNIAYQQAAVSRGNTMASTDLARWKRERNTMEDVYVNLDEKPEAKPAKEKGVEQHRLAQKETLASVDHRAGLLTGFYELCKPLQEAFAPFLEDEIFRKEAEERFSQFQSNTKLRQESSLDFLHSLASVVGVDDTTHGASHSDELMVGLQTLSQPLQEALAPYLEDETIRVQAQEWFAKLGSDTQLRQESASDLLNALGLEDEIGNEGHNPAKDTKRRGDLTSSALTGYVKPSGEAVPLDTRQPVPRDETEPAPEAEAAPAPEGGAPPTPGDEAILHQGPEVEVEPPIQLPNPHENFFDWATLQSRPLDPTDDIMQNNYLATLALYEAVKVTVSVQGVSIRLEGIARLLRHYLRKDDVLAFFRSVRRTILIPLDNPEEDVDEQHLKRLDNNLFDISKFNGFDERLTSVTYSYSRYGTITLFKLTRAADRRPKMIRPLAAMKGVPKIVVEKIGEGIRGAIKTTLTMPHHEIWRATEQRRIEIRPTVLQPNPLQPNLVGFNGHDGANPIGLILQSALSIDDADELPRSVVATVPQMVAMLHHKTDVIENIRSTRVNDTPEEEGLSWVRMEGGPDMNGHAYNGPRVYIIVLAPARGQWVRETFAWK